MSNTNHHTTPDSTTPDAFAELRRRMVEEQLREHGISDPRVLDAMGRVPREEFVPADLRDAAYEDGPLPIGAGQTISQPFTVALMCEALQLEGTEKVLEIGAGSGYSAAVLSLLAKSVFTVERIPGLARTARMRLEQLGYGNVRLITGDGTLGLPAETPFDAIVVTAGAETLPDAYVRQLRPGGRIVIPIGGYRYNQTMYRFTRLPEELRVENLGGFAFVPLVGKFGWHEPGAG
jgi:protein-L-isoaspartate(D-aspartate) O-methyltransferase